MTDAVALAVCESGIGLLETLNSGIARIKKSGEFDPIVEKWGSN